MTWWVGYDKVCAVVSCEFCVIPAAKLAALSCELAWSRSDSPQPENAYGESERLGLGSVMNADFPALHAAWGPRHHISGCGLDYIILAEYFFWEMELLSVNLESVGHSEPNLILMSHDCLIYESSVTPVFTYGCVWPMTFSVCRSKWCRQVVAQLL